MGPGGTYLGLRVTDSRPSSVPHRHSVGHKWQNAHDSVEQKSTGPMGRGRSRYVERSTAGGSTPKIGKKKEEKNILDTHWVDMGGVAREMKGSMFVSKVGGWGCFSVWLVASTDSGAQGATVHGARCILNPWYHNRQS